ncbi:TPA: flippase [Vibrio vulnificus]
MSIIRKVYQLFSSRIIRNLGWNFASQIIPLLSALICIPVLIDSLGEEKFGFLAIAWVVIGYFSLFDLGLGRAITYTVSQKKVQHQDYIPIVNTALKFMIYISMIVVLVIASASGFIATNLLSVTLSLQSEASQAMFVLSFGIPFVILSIGLRGVLEAYQDFKVISYITIPTGIFLFVLPVIISIYSTSLVFVFSGLVIVRVIQFLLFIFMLKNKIKFNLFNPIDKTELKKLLMFGGWMTVSNIVSPIMVNMDRFFLGAKIAVASVAHYVVPFDLITKALVLPSAISGVLFPEFSKLLSKNKFREARSLMLIAMFLLGVSFLVPLSVVFFLADEILTTWISAEFAEKSVAIFQVLAIGVWFNGLAYIPFSFVQGNGRSDLTAKFHVCELIGYIPILLFFIDSFGVVGAAYAWSLRVTIDFFLLLVSSLKLLKC